LRLSIYLFVIRGMLCVPITHTTLFTFPIVVLFLTK